MLGKEERKIRNTAFWDDFRKQMRNLKSSNGRRINWISYPSDVKNIYIRMEVEGRGVRLCMDIQPKDDGVRAILFEQMTELKNLLEKTMSCETIWLEHFTTKEGSTISRIMWENNNLSFYNDEDWPLIVDFLSHQLVEFDLFYQEFKDILIALAE